jgi:hypothetical protein
MASFIEIGSSAYGKTAYSILVGTVGSIILMAFLNTIVLPAASVKFLPLVIAFNAALTGYMVVEKTRSYFQHKWSLAVVAGLSTTLLTFGALNLFFLQTTGLFLISLPQLAVMLVLGIGSSWFGAVLAINYLDLN